jgi:DNA-binding response OmpR family regulator
VPKRALVAHHLVMATPMILVVDDEPMVRDVLARYLERDGFTVATAADGQAALDAVEHDDPDLVLLDLMLPKIDGLGVFERLRSRSAVPVIMVTARGEETDRVVGLGLGADDYVTKPFSPREVVARVRAVLRRSGGPVAVPTHGTISFDDLEIDAGRRELRKGKEHVRLSPREFDLLWYFASQPGRTFTRSKLLEDVWDFAWDGDPATVTVHIRRIREKIEADPAEPRHLVTVWGLGYRFEP